MKKAGIFAAVIAVVLLFAQFYNYRLLGYTQDVMPDVFYFPLSGDKGAVKIKIHALECVFYKLSGGKL